MRVQLFCDDEHLAKQSFKDMCDINNILKKWLKTGICPHVSTAVQTFRDVTQVGDYQDMMFRVLDAQESFDSLPSEVRKKFRNDPIELLDFISDPQNEKEAIELGLLDVTVSTPESGSKTVTEAVAPAAPDS